MKSKRKAKKPRRGLGELKTVMGNSKSTKKCMVFASFRHILPFLHLLQTLFVSLSGAPISTVLWGGSSYGLIFSITAVKCIDLWFPYILIDLQCNGKFP